MRNQLLMASFSPCGGAGNNDGNTFVAMSHRSHKYSHLSNSFTLASKPAGEALFRPCKLFHDHRFNLYEMCMMRIVMLSEDEYARKKADAQIKGEAFNEEEQSEFSFKLHDKKTQLVIKRHFCPKEGKLYRIFFASNAPTDPRYSSRHLTGIFSRRGMRQAVDFMASTEDLPCSRCGSAKRVPTYRETWRHVRGRNNAETIKLLYSRMKEQNRLFEELDLKIDARYMRMLADCEEQNKNAGSPCPYQPHINIDENEQVDNVEPQVNIEENQPENEEVQQEVVAEEPAEAIEEEVQAHDDHNYAESQPSYVIDSSDSEDEPKYSPSSPQPKQARDDSQDSYESPLKKKKK